MFRRTLLIIAAVAISAMVVAACNGDDIADDIDPGETADEVDDRDDGVDPEEPDEGAARTDDGDAAGQTGGSPADDDADLLSDQLEVTLTDHEIEMDSTADEGMIAFIISNEGEDQHGISIIPADGEEGDELGSMEVAPGEEQQLELELEAGDYIVYCPIGDHRDEYGMETELTVEEVEED
jgi:hypothetical protein